MRPVVTFEYVSRIVSFTDTPPVLHCAGDEVRCTQGHRRRAIARALRAQADVIVDLSELGFTDASLMVDLALLARRLRPHGRALMLRGAQPQVRAVIESVGIHRLDGVVLDGPAPAVA